MFRSDLYRKVTDKILDQLQSGCAPWVKPWSATPSANVPCNAVTNRPYSGCNIILLWIEAQSNAWTSLRFLTFKQALSVGGNVRRGEHGFKVYYYERIAVKDRATESNDAMKLIPLLKEYTVFHTSQCENLPERVVNPNPLAPQNTEERDQIADSFLTSMKADIREGNGEAYYVPSKDFISMPSFAAFKSADSFYATTFHELGHWTGAKHRLAREMGKRFGDLAYAGEELVAELTSAFLCAEFAVDGDIRHASYIEHWIRLLTHDSRAFFTAASKAQQAADYLRGLALAESVDDTEERNGIAIEIADKLERCNVAA
jgi:antirestriction protein ArdC